jgi:RNA polymerase sigma-70 factor (TIGR02943 family)
MVARDNMTSNERMKNGKKESQDLEEWFRDHADGLYRYSVLRVGDPAKAEDLVQETFLAAFKSKESYAGQSSIRGWLLGILKHKIADHFRKEYRDRDAAQELGDNEDVSGQFGMLCWAKGFGPGFWSDDPHCAVEDKQFLEVVQNCLKELPEHLRKIFVLREIEELATREIQEIVGAKSGYVRVMLHRGRVLLRSCVERIWLKDSTKEGM